MATAPVPPAPQAGQNWAPQAGQTRAAQLGQTGAAPALPEGTGIEASHALVAAPRVQAEDEKPAFSPLILALPVEVDVAVPIRDFRVRQLLALAPGQVIASRWANGNDLPLSAGDVQLAWTEFEVVETRLAVRVTRVA